MLPLPVAAGLMAGGTALSIFGNIKSNRDQATAIGQNIQWLMQQQRFMDIAAQREQRLFQNQANAVMGAQSSIAGASGLEASGSVLDVMASTYAEAQDELNAMRSQAKMQRIQSNFDIQQMRTEKKRVGSFGWNLLQATTTGLNAFSSVAPMFTSRGN